VRTGCAFGGTGGRNAHGVRSRTNEDGARQGLRAPPLECAPCPARSSS
jgi:hypothetical protein